MSKQMTIAEALEELKKIIPESQFRKEPESSTAFLIKLEGKYQLNTVSFLTQSHNLNVSEDDIEDWLNAYENFKLFKGDERLLNTI